MPNPDNRNDNVERIQENINHTIQNIELANDMINNTSDAQTRESLIAKNERRENSLNSLRHEIKDEALAREN